MLKLLTLLLLGLVAGPVLAASSAQLPNTRVELVSEVARPAPGQRFTIGIVMTPQPEWHTYWKHPGDSGIETRATWSTPDGVTVSPFRYPVPETYVVSGIMNHVYSAENVLLAEVDVPQGASGPLPLSVKLDWLVCNAEICVPETATLTLPLNSGDGSADPAQQQRFADARAALPRPLSEPAGFARDGNRIRLSIPLAGTDSITAAHFFATADDTLVLAAPQTLSRTETALIIETDAVPGSNAPRVDGLLRIEREDGVLGLEVGAVPGAVGTGKPLAQATAAGSMTGFLPALGLALLGGLVLNLMPCVFPILSLKALSLAKSGHGEAAARSEGLAYTGGVILVCTMLGGAAIALARAGEGAGWAFQLQDPRVILLLMLLTLAIGLNFAGLFEMQLGGASAGQSLASKPGAKGAFWTGALAAFVATPCTGPFMAGALGAALVLPPAAGLAVFAGLGLGLALPFLAIGFIPALRRRLPKPGQWMVTFRRVLAIPMLLTALALAWVLGRQAGAEGLTLGLLFALIVGLGLWWLGLRQHNRGRTLVPAMVAVVAALVAPAALARLPQPVAGQNAGTSSGLPHVAFSPAALDELTAAKKPVFLYFTADWCLTCKVNEKGALASSEVAEAFTKAGIQVMVGDWTRPDPAIAKFLESRGRAGIPLYLFFHGDGKVEELPQLLTTDQLVGLASSR